MVQILEKYKADYRKVQAEPKPNRKEISELNDSLDKEKYNELLENKEDFVVIQMMIQMECCDDEPLHNTLKKRVEWVSNL